LARKKDPPAKAESPRPSALRRWLVQGVVVIGVAAAFLGGVLFLGRWGLEQIRGQERYLVPFADIECTPPPGLTRAAFLDEVQYESCLPDRVGLLDDDLVQKLTAAFAKHPWVERVDRVLLQPPRKVYVQLAIRRPVLAVPTPEGLIAVDQHGVRLPRNADTKDLPVFDGNAPLPGPAGTVWGDPQVEERARQHGRKPR
jgi:hypothetical protein